jgi:hypothetical protein
VTRDQSIFQVISFFRQQAPPPSSTHEQACSGVSMSAGAKEKSGSHLFIHSGGHRHAPTMPRISNAPTTSSTHEQACSGVSMSAGANEKSGNHLFIHSGSHRHAPTMPRMSSYDHAAAPTPMQSSDEEIGLGICSPLDRWPPSIPAIADLETMRMQQVSRELFEDFGAVDPYLSGLARVKPENSLIVFESARSFGCKIGFS